MHNP